MLKAAYPFLQLHINAPLRPYLPINWYNPHQNKHFLTYSLADTGADSSLLPGWTAKQTGHNITGKGVESVVSQGISGVDIRTWKHTFVVKLMDPDISYTFWQSSEQLIDCVEHGNIPPLLGVSDFLSNFKITFDYKNKATILEY